MYIEYELHKNLIKILKKLEKKDCQLYNQILNKIKEISTS